MYYSIAIGIFRRGLGTLQVQLFCRKQQLQPLSSPLGQQTSSLIYAERISRLLDIPQPFHDTIQ